MKKFILILLLGLTIMVGGCVPFSLAIKKTFNVNEVLNESISINKKYTTSIINVNHEHLILPVIKLQLTTKEISRNTESPGDEYQAKYRFPITLLVTNNFNKKLYEYNGKLEWNQGTKSYDKKNVSSRDGKIIVDIDLEKIKIPAPGKIKVSVLLGEDSYYYAELQSAKLIIYDNVYKHISAILTGVGLIILGILVFIIGLVMIILKQTNATSHNDMNPENNQSATTTKVDANFEKDKDLKNSSICTIAMLCHLSTFTGLLIPFGGILGPLIVWLTKKDEHAFINRHGIASLNFHLSMAIYYFVSFLLAFVVIGFFLLMVLAVIDLILTILASIKASNGEEYSYPLTIQFIKTAIQQQ